MKKHCLVTVLALSAWTASAAWAIDQIRKNDGTPPVIGRITDMSPLRVAIEANRGGGEIPVSQIAQVIFDGEPGALKTAKTQILAGHYGEGLATLEKVEMPGKGMDRVVGGEIREVPDFIKKKPDVFYLQLRSHASFSDQGLEMPGSFQK